MLFMANTGHKFVTASFYSLPNLTTEKIQCLQPSRLPRRCSPPSSKRATGCMTLFRIGLAVDAGFVHNSQ